MLNAFGNNEYFAGAEGNLAIPQLDVERSFEDEKKIVCLVMFVPMERPFKLGHHDVVVIVSGNGAGRLASAATLPRR